jgi:hypothetical protein
VRARGTTIRDEDLVHIWPLQRRHITPNGVYFANRTMPAFILPDGERFRPIPVPRKSGSSPTAVCGSLVSNG